jgi:hypothetical protein
MSEFEVIERAFKKMGAEAMVADPNRHRRGRGWRIDIVMREDREVFLLDGMTENLTLQVVQVDREDRHLLLHVGEKMSDGTTEKSKFLCGHDERHWFVAAIPEKERVTTIKDAKEALKPKELPKFRDWYRQGEWFFVPRPEFHLPRGAATTHNEALVRRTRDGRGGKAHYASEAYRHGGVSVYFNQKHAPQGFTKTEYEEWKEKNPKEAKITEHAWRQMVRDAKVYVRGEVRHPDHATLKLGTVWHEVLQNREAESRAMANMVFLD